MTDVTTNDPIEAMEGMLLEQFGTAPDIAEHFFAPGKYVRKISLPAGSVILGHMHKGPCLNLMLKGKMLVWMNGITMVVSAPCEFISEGGTRKVAHVLEDMEFATVHQTDETDIEKLEAELFEASTTWTAHKRKELCLPQQS